MMKPHARLALILGTAALLLTACRVLVDTTILPDGSGTLRTAIVFSTEEKQNFSQAPGNKTKNICDNLRPNVPADATFTAEEHNGETYCVTSRPFADLQELRQLYAQMNNVTVRQLQFELGRLTVDVDVDLTQATNNEAVVQEWRLTLPGSISQHNADQVDGETLIWTILPNERVTLQAETAVGLTFRTLGIAGLALLAGGCGSIVGVGVGIGYIIRRRRSSGGRT
jgi:hypothetical protein